MTFCPHLATTTQEQTQDLLSVRARSAMLAALVLGMTACDDHIDLNAPSARLDSPNRPSQLTSQAAFAITSVSLSSKTLVLGGPPVTYTAALQSSVQSFKGLSLRASFVQQHVRHVIEAQGIPCGFGNSSCTITNPIQASGILPGPAVFELELLDAGGVAVSTFDTGITVVVGQTISALNVSPTSIVLGGPVGSYTATLQNQATSVSGVTLQGWLNQSGTNTARRAAGGIAVQCGSGSGVLPSGACGVSSAIAASNSNGGTGTLVPGPATFELDLMVNGVLVSLDSVPVSIVAGGSITSVRLAATSDTLLLDGSALPYTASLQNIGSSVAGISIQSVVTQGSANRFAGAALVSCGVAAGVLPSGSCSTFASATASNNTAGKGTLVTGPANLEVQLIDAAGTVLSKVTLPVFVVDGPLEPGPPAPSASRAVGAKKGSSLR